MARPSNNNPGNIPAEAKRLMVVYNEYEGEQTSLAKILGTSQPSLSKMLNGKQPITLRVTKGVCFRLGYAAEWFINGTGSKKKTADSVKMITEISMLRTEIDIMLAFNLKLQARMEAYEKNADNIQTRDNAGTHK